MKVYEFPHSKYVFTVDDEKHEFKVLRYGTEDVTDSVMNNPLQDLLLAYDSLSEQYESLKTSIKDVE